MYTVRSPFWSTTIRSPSSTSSSRLNSLPLVNARCAAMAAFPFSPKGAVSIMCPAASFMFSWVAPSSTGSFKLIFSMVKMAMAGLGVGVGLGVAAASADGDGEAASAEAPVEGSASGSALASRSISSDSSRYAASLAASLAASAWGSSAWVSWRSISPSSRSCCQS
ncbi:hypothetical protein D3C75_953810 [compost metagenome]